MLPDTGEGGVIVDIAIETDNRQAIEALRGIEGVGDALTTERRGADGASLITIVLTLIPPSLLGSLQLFAPKSLPSDTSKSHAKAW